MEKIWRNRIEAGTKMLINCPTRYRNLVITLIQNDIENNIFTKEQLKELVRNEKMTSAEYFEITNESYVEEN